MRSIAGAGRGWRDHAEAGDDIAVGERLAAACRVLNDGDDEAGVEVAQAGAAGVGDELAAALGAEHGESAALERVGDAEGEDVAGIGVGECRGVEVFAEDGVAGFLDESERGDGAGEGVCVGGVARVVELRTGG